MCVACIGVCVPCFVNRVVNVCVYIGVCVVRLFACVGMLVYIVDHVVVITDYVGVDVVDVLRWIYWY